VPELQSKPVDGAQKQANLSKISRRLWFWLIFWVLAILGAVAVVVNFQTEATVTFCSLFLGICFVALPWEISRTKFFRGRYLAGKVTIDSRELPDSTRETSEQGATPVVNLQV